MKKIPRNPKSPFGFRSLERNDKKWRETGFSLTFGLQKRLEIVKNDEKL